MSRLYYPNLMFEEQLQGNSRMKASAQALVDDLAPCFGLLSGAENDFVLVRDEAIPTGIPDVMQSLQFLTIAEAQAAGAGFCEFIPWGWSEPAGQLASKLVPTTAVPPLDAIRTVNSRRFQNTFDEWCRLDDESFKTAHDEPFSRVCTCLSDVNDWLKSLHKAHSIPAVPWVIKAEFSQAARNRILGEGLELDPRTTGWLRNQFTQKTIVSAEPWRNRVAEAGLQFTVTPDPFGTQKPTIQFDGLTEMVTAADGRYIGSLIHCSTQCQSIWDKAIRHGYHIACAAGGLSYTGWLGIDCMILEDATGSPGSNRLLRMAHDLNGRCTMGRIALHLGKLLGPEESGFWFQLRQTKPANTDFPLAPKLPSGVSIQRTSPCRIGQRDPQITTWLLTGSDSEAILHVSDLCRQFSGG
ncbi:MAG: hypothetical protein R3C20_18860 [Planctomycetaceae bacterium]